jgi:tape measure domain-containing protein
MATGTNRDVKMTLSVETLGEQGIADLQRSVSNLAKEGGSAAPAFQKLADEIGQLGEQSAALQAFQQLVTMTGALATQQEQAAVRSAELKTQLDSLAVKSQGARDAQQQVAAALADARTSALDTRDALARLTAQTAEAKAADKGYADAVSELKLRKIEQRAEIERLSAAMKSANADVSQAEAAEGRLANAYKQAATAATATATALQAHETAVSSASAAAQTLGVSTDNVASAQVQLVQGLNQAGQAAQTLQDRVNSLAAEQRALAAIKPFEKMADEARSLVQAAQEVNAFDRALEDIFATQKQVAALDTAAKWQREAFALVEAAESTRKLAHETEVLAAAERELAAQAAFSKQAADARALVQAGEYVRFWREELDKAEQQAANTALAAKAAAQKIDDAFRTLGVRSAADLRAEITQVRDAMETIRAKAATTGESLSGAFTSGEAKIKALEREIRKAEGALTTADKASALFANSLGQIAAGNLIADGVGYLVNKVKELGRAFLDAVVQGDQMRRGLTAVYGDARIAAQQIDFLRKSSSESGVAFGALSQEFVKFSAAMKMANIPMEQSNALFKSLTAVSATLGLGTEATAGALNALGQMASKGVVSLEELRAQVGDRLPGALGLAAKGLGITEAQLIKLVESGQLATRDFIGPFTSALNTMKGEVDGIVPSWDRFKGLLSETAQNAGDSGWAQILNLAIKVLGGTVGVFTLGLSALSEALFLAVKSLAAMAVAFTSPKAAVELMTEAVEQSRQRLTSQAAALNALIEPTNAVAAATSATAATMTGSTAATVQAVNANTQLNSAQKLTALSTALAGDATLSAAAKIVQYNVAAAELLKSQEAQTEAYQKADTLVEVARLTGNTVEVQRASLLAAEMYAAAMDKVAASQAAETTMLIAQKAELVASAQARGISADQIKVQVDTLDKLILKSQAETEQANQSSEAAKQARFERSLQIELLKDHSTQITEFGARVEEAKEKLKQYEVQAAQGERTDEEVTAAKRELAKATALYRDAISDSIAGTQLATQAQVAHLQVSQAQATERQKHYESLAKEARVTGDVTKAQENDTKAKKEAIKAIEAKIKIDELQIKAAIIEIEMKRKLVDGSTEEGKAKLKLLDIELELLKIKQAKVQGSQDEIKNLEREIKAVDGLTEAYHQLGLKTPEELKKISEANTAAWEKIKGDANASVSTLKAAFTAYAQTALDASGDVGSGQRAATEAALQQEAAVKGLTVTFDQYGKMVVQTNGEAAAAIDKTTSALEKQNAVQEKKIAALEKENDLKKRAIDLENKRLNRDSEGFALDDQGKRRVEYRETERSLFDRIKAQGGNELTEAQVLALVQQFYRDQNPVNYLELTKEINATVMRNIKARAHADPTLGGASGDARQSQTPTGNPPSDPVAQDEQTQRVIKLVQQTPPAPAPAPRVPEPSPVNSSQSSGSVKASETNLTINVAAGVNMSSRGDVEKLARAIMPAINNLQRKGVSAG